MKVHPTSKKARSKKGFTLAEAAITIAIVGLTITYTLQALTSAQTTAAHTHELKLAREMALRTLGEVSTGQFDAQTGEVIIGNYPEDLAPFMTYQIAFGDTSLPTRGTDQEEDSNKIDNWANRRQWEQDNSSDEEEEGMEEDYETVTIRVIFPKHSKELDDSIEIEAWIPWAQVYGVEEEEEGAEDGTQDDPAEGENSNGNGEARNEGDTNGNR